jgi:hypothetical protein
MRTLRRSPGSTISAAISKGKARVREKPDALYVWAWKGQAGTAEACADPVKAWGYAENVLREAKER